MSDTSKGPGWRRASDGKWHAPESHPDNESLSPGVARRLQGPVSFGQASGGGERDPQSEATQTAGSLARPAKIPSQDWYRHTWVIVVALIVFFPVGLALMWISGWKTPTKIVVSAAFVVLAVLGAITSKPVSKNTQMVLSTANTQARKSAAPAPTTTAPAPTTTAPAGPILTQQQQSAAEQAMQYLSTQAFSQQGLIDQLDSSFGGGYSVNDATVAVDSLTVNWNAEAVQAAKEYLASQPFSCSNLIQQLDSPYGSQFTVAQATYGAQQAGDC